MFETVMANIFLPMMDGYNKWGELSETPQGRKTIQKFLDTISGFVGYLQGTYITVFLYGQSYKMILWLLSICSS
jgi:hypothetical protein